MASLPLLLALLAAAAAIALAVGLYQLLGADAGVSGRLEEYLGTVKRGERGSEGRERRRGAASPHSLSAGIAQELLRANLRLTVSEYLFMHAVVALVAVAIGFVFLRNLGLAMPLALVGLILPRMYVGRRQSQRLSAFNNQLADTMMLTANSLRSGYSLLQSFEVVSRESPPPTSEEFGRVVREVSLGLAPEEALQNLVRRINSDDLELMATAINIQHEAGGNLARILDSISGTIRERVRIRGEIRTLTASQRMTGYIVSGLPLGVALLLYLVNPSYLMKLFTLEPLICMPTIGLPIISGTLIVVAFMVIRKIVAIEV